jgi:hypothetical protein
MAVLAFDVPIPTSEFASKRIILSLYRESSREMADPTAPAPMIAMS